MTALRAKSEKLRVEKTVAGGREVTLSSESRERADTAEPTRHTTPSTHIKTSNTSHNKYIHISEQRGQINISKPISSANNKLSAFCFSRQML